MTRDELLARISEKIPKGVFAKLSEQKVISAGVPIKDNLSFKLEIFLAGHEFSRKSALGLYEEFRALIPEAEEAFFKEEHCMEWDYDLCFDLIGYDIEQIEE